MDEKPKNIWKKSWTGRSATLIWALLIATAILLGILIPALVSVRPVADYFDKVARLFLLGVVGCFVIIYIVLPLSRWLLLKHWRRTLFGLACLATLIALFYAEEDWRGWHAWNQFKREWEAKGEKFDYASIVPPAVPDDQNFAIAPIWVESMKAVLGPKNSAIWFGNNYAENGRTNFTDRLAMNMAHVTPYYEYTPETATGHWPKGTVTDLKPWQTYFRTPDQSNPKYRFQSSLKTTNEFPVASQPQTPAADVLLALSKYDPAIEELRSASQLPYSRFPLEYYKDDPAAILLPHLADLKRCSQGLQLRAVAELQNGQPGKALDDVKLSFRLMEAVRNEPILISHLVRIAILNLVLQPVYEGLAEHKWSDMQLTELDSELAKQDFLADYKLAMRGEMIFQGRIFDYLRNNPAQLINLFGDDSYNFGGANPPLPERIVTWLIPTGWFYQNQFHCARSMVNLYLPEVNTEQRMISPTKIRAAGDAIDADTHHLTPNNFIERFLLPALGGSAKKFAYAQTSVDLARTAIALERYRLAHGEFPESLDTLAPQFISVVPHDVIGGQPIKYRRTVDGQFVLYSVGWNERDDGGVVVFYSSGQNVDNLRSVDNSQGDWVWRYPAKVE